MSFAIMIASISVLIAPPIVLWRILHRRGLSRCAMPYLLQFRRRRTVSDNEPVHLLLCIADHFEPRWRKATELVAQQRVQNWVEQYPESFAAFRDADGRPPRHTFFFPIDQYDPEHVDALADLCREGFGEVEIHLHHENDTAENLRQTLLHFTKLFAERHGLLSRPRIGNGIGYGFVHGNWALDNSRPDGQWCGVNSELDVLRETGCYADFTLPSAPSATQTRKINSIYYAKDDPDCPRSHDWGVDLGTAPPPEDSLMLIQGPLVLDWRRRKLENGCLQASQPPDMHRLDLWMRARIHVPARRNWIFVKLHTHGAPEANQRILLGEAMIEFHRGLQKRTRQNRHFHFHYVTAREMCNLALAAEAGYGGDVAGALNYQFTPISSAHTASAAA